MHNPPAAIFSLVVAVCGWYYLFYSRAAHKLRGIEADRVNGRRVLLRRLSGAAMCGLAVSFFAAFCVLDEKRELRGIAVLVAISLAFLMAIVVLAIADVRLTLKLRCHKR